MCKTKVKEENLKEISRLGQEKPLREQCRKRAGESGADMRQTHQWQRGVGLKAKTDGFILAAQDQSRFSKLSS